MSDLVSGVRFAPAGARDRASGLLGWASFVLGGIVRLDGVSVRRTRRGDLALSFPSRTGSSGQRFPFIRPLGDQIRRDLERQVIDAIDLGGGCVR